MKECFEHTDLEWRLQHIPDRAACRGVFFNMLDTRARAFGVEVQREYRDFFKLHDFSALRLYPVKDYLTRLVKLAQIQFGGPNIYQGIFQIQEQAFPTWKTTLIGRAGFAIFGANLEAVLDIICRPPSKAQNYGRAELTRIADGFEVRFFDEYVYIQHAMAGALKGVARACNKEVKVSVELKDAFEGCVHLKFL
jgi:uncharacterized protein (TIGR02265 family)